MLSSNILKGLLSILAGYLLSVAIVRGLPWLYLLGLFLLLVLVFLFYRNPLFFIGTLLLFRASIDSYMVNVRFAIGGMDLGLAGGFSLLLVGLVLMAILTDPDTASVSKLKHPLVGLYVLYCFYAIFNTFYSADKAFAFKVVLRDFSILAIMMLVILKVKKTEDAFFVLKAIAWSFVPIIAIGYLTRVSMYQEIRGLRYCGTLSHPNIMAFYLLVIMACHISMLSVKVGEIRAKRISQVGLLVILVMLLYTKTRSEYVAFVFLLFFYCFFYNKKFIFPSLFICVALVFVPSVNSDIVSLFDFTGGKIALNPDSSLAWRLEKWGYLFQEGIHKPFFGHGMGASHDFGRDKLAAHNDYAQFFLESGIVGLLLYIVPFLKIIKAALKSKKQSTPESLMCKLAAFFLIFVPPFLIMSISENLASYVIIQWYFWAIVGIYISLSWNEKNAVTAQ